MPHSRTAPDRWLVPAGALLLTGCLSSCNTAPTQSILGSFFPSWMICFLIGAVASVAIRLILSAVGMARAVPAALLVHLILAVAVSFAVWLLWQD
ncbi:YtcA family lipoprotein [Nitrospirillum amazonense]|uniref:Uncharacterized protein YtcA n=1 Tax=Nitrospirillum amazonense TaxID=28077 RepID=A0A560JET5_9PROT|nr:YtcA family lipoprotein [Nitrospirillum amazonense]MDG3439486.1 YtcA family lipoprotein [Nitrospirillum amazonense]TWB69721.1 YtcA family uncharacterized protein [Nitrospirillum amazonense]